MHSLRAQADKKAYQLRMRRAVDDCENLDLRQAEVRRILVENSRVTGVETTTGSRVACRAVVACCGDVPTLEALAATDALQDLGLKIRFVNVVKLLAIQNASENDQAISDEEFEKLFGPEGTPVLFAFHAYAGTIRRLIWDRPNHDHFMVHGYEEHGSTTTPFDMLRQNHMDRWALASDVLRAVDAEKFADKIREYTDFREEAFQFAVDNGYDHPRFTEWVWRDVVGHQDNSAAAMSSTGGDNDE